ncbi:MAG TPA: hypothetical protein VKU87_10040 [Thermomicrobiaceae bacterium]|nr:hypothetical protein [Thermomicrobiaceae bacterium]
MSHYQIPVEGHHEETPYSGKVLLAGTGIMVSATIWALLGWIQGYKGSHELAVLDCVLVALHLIIGPIILKRFHIGWALGIALTIVAVICTIVNGYYLAVAADGISGLLLFFCRTEMFGELPATGSGNDQPPGGSV